MVEKRPIDKLVIKGFKSLQDVELELGRLNVLIGPNGGGKSNLISFFEMLRHMVEGDLQVWTGQQDGANRVLTFGAKSTPQLDASLYFGDNVYLFSLAHTAADRFVFRHEAVSMPERYDEPHWLGRGHQEALLKSRTMPAGERPRQADYCYQSITNWQVYHFHDTGRDARLKQTHGLHDNWSLRHDAANLAAYLHMLRDRHPEVYADIVATVQQALPFFGDFVLLPESNGKGSYSIRLMWRSKYADEAFLADQLSDGSLRFICLVTALKQPEPPATIIFDEPELGLHPYAITLLGSLLDSAAEDMQVIVATQSPHLLDEFSVDDLIVVELENGASTFRRLGESQFGVWLKDFSVGELWEKNVLGGGLP